MTARTWTNLRDIPVDTVFLPTNNGIPHPTRPVPYRKLGPRAYRATDGAHELSEMAFTNWLVWANRFDEVTDGETAE